MKHTLFSLIAAAACAGACGSSSTSPAPIIVTTKMISVTGDLAFGGVNIGSRADRTFAINNAGQAPMTFTSLSCAGGTGSDVYTFNPASGVVPSNGSITVDVQFTPRLAEFYSCVLSVIGNQTSGDASIDVSGTGVDISH